MQGVLQSFGTSIPTSEGRTTEDRNILREDPATSDSPTDCLALSLAYLRKGDLDEAISWMQKALQKYPDDKFLEYYREMCNIAGRDPLDTANVTSVFGKGTKMKIPGLEDNPLSVGEAKKWVQAYESGAVDTALQYYQEELDETADRQGLASRGHIRERELRCIEIVRNHIYLLKLFITS